MTAISRTTEWRQRKAAGGALKSSGASAQMHDAKPVTIILDAVSRATAIQAGGGGKRGVSAGIRLALAHWANSEDAMKKFNVSTGEKNDN